MSFEKILSKYRAISFSERDKGDRFERLMQAYLKTDPKYAYKFKHVWLWNEFPGREDLGGSDTGIDLVALTQEGDYWAIQCKCYQENATIDKPSIDSFLSTSSRHFTNELGVKSSFAHRLWIDTIGKKWGSNAEEAIRNQNPEVTRLNLFELREAPVDWDKLEQGIHGEESRTPRKSIRPHQNDALQKTHEHFAKHDRGKLIMACGTGKTFTALRIAEHETNGNGLILFLVPSIALLGQSLREWCADALEPINAVCICSDAEITKKKTKNEDSDGFSVVDLALPASTNPDYILYQFQQIKEKNLPGMTVVFSTYQSIEVISRVQKVLMANGFPEFDLIICDEAHRTTGVTLADEDESAFVKVHDNTFIQSRKRIYMTATPRLYNDETKSKAAQLDAMLCSMDDPAMYGEEMYRIGFGEAVEKALLTDYKVLILTLSDKDVTPAVQRMIADEESEINSDDASKLIGCINALSKQILGDQGLLKNSDPEPMRRAVAFCSSIAASKKINSVFNTATETYLNDLPKEKKENMVSIASQHIDGTMSAPQRDEMLSWLKTPTENNECRILTNVKVLSEGVDVPSLDAVLFLSARNSQVDVVQSVGRVMRRAEGKKYGYIIIPVVVPFDVEADKALDNNDRFKVVWTVLNALRAHDDRFNATVNKIELNKKKPTNILVGGIDYSTDRDTSERALDQDDRNIATAKDISAQMAIQFEQLQNVIFARMVEKVGDRRYWEQWAKDVAIIAERQIERIKFLIADRPDQRQAFDNFLAGLQKNINPSITEAQAIDMLAQHIITQPIFEALFEGYSFVKNNAVSTAMQSMLDALQGESVAEESETLQKFYESVRKRAEGIDNAEGKQRIIIELYDKFFKAAFPKMVEQLGIVYTPVEVVDFIIRSVDDVLKKEFDRSISDENIHILDPFTGTGTFITRLLQSGLINHKDLERKYKHELHANEIVLLAYYIAAVNIENAYHDAVVSSPPSPLLKGEGGVRTVEVNIPPVLLEHARELRKNQTEAEEMLWQLLRNRQLGNLKFRRQHPLKVNFILDFYCAEARLGIEVDGGYHTNADQREYDQLRTEAISQYGIRIIRFTNEEVLQKTQQVLSTILHEATPPLSQMERGSGGEEYIPFEGIVLTDTFQLGETDESQKLFSEMFPQNSARVARQKKAPLRVIIGNPPYSIGQNSANDDAQNHDYPKLNSRISVCYGQSSDAKLKALYDSYIKAFRWASDRLDQENGGIIGFVTNGSWLDSNGLDGFRKSIEQEFSGIWVFNLRGNQRTSGELSRKEGGKIFGSGSRTPICITFLVKKPYLKGDKAAVFYHDIGDYLTREEKLAKIQNFKSLGNGEMIWKKLLPNDHGDWLTQRNDIFISFIPIAPDRKYQTDSKAYFISHSLGNSTARDAWVYNFSRYSLEENVILTINHFNETLDLINKKNNHAPVKDSKKGLWNVDWKILLKRGTNIIHDVNEYRVATYRPFTKVNSYFEKDLLHSRYQLLKLFPKKDSENIIINVTGIGVNKEFSVLVIDRVPDLQVIANGQCFPLYIYEERQKNSPSLFDVAGDPANGGSSTEYIRRDGVSDFILERAKKAYGLSPAHSKKGEGVISKEDIFYYVYGVLHSPDYRTAFANDLKKMLPRIPLVEDVRDFWKFSKSGRALAELHINYESVAPAPGVIVLFDRIPKEEIAKGIESGKMNDINFRIEKMRFPKKGQKDTIIYNSQITITEIPEKAYDYVVNGKSAIEWIMERYQVTINKDSGIKNDPNDWAAEVGNSRYILDLLLSVINVSVQTVEIVEGLPEIEFK